LTFLQRIIAIFRAEPVKSGYIVIPKAMLDELPKDEQPAVRRMLTDLTGRVRLRYPGQWFQVILRESSGKFRKHPAPDKPAPNELFKEEL
jgi:hypothetical protein